MSTDSSGTPAAPAKASLARMVLVVGPVATSNGADTAPAVITRVWTDTMVNVVVFPDGTTPRPATSINLCADEAAARALLEGNQYGNAAYWPPRV